MGKKKKSKAPPKPWQNEFEGLSEGMESFWKGARDGIYERRGEKLLAQLDQIAAEKGKELSCPKGGYAILPERVLDLTGLEVLDFHSNLLREDNIPDEFYMSPALTSLTTL